MAGQCDRQRSATSPSPRHARADPTSARSRWRRSAAPTRSSTAPRPAPAPPPGAPSVSLTTTRAGSWVWGVGNDWDAATERTVGLEPDQGRRVPGPGRRHLLGSAADLDDPLERHPGDTQRHRPDQRPLEPRCGRGPSGAGHRTPPPPAPTLTSTVPASPANQNSPKVLGSAAAGSQVSIYSTSGCTGTPLATGTAAELGTGITVTVADNSSTALRATATTSGNTSSCSAPLTYVEDSAAPQTQIGNPPAGAQRQRLGLLRILRRRPRRLRRRLAAVPPRLDRSERLGRLHLAEEPTAASPTGPPLRSAGDRPGRQHRRLAGRLRMADRHDAADRGDRRRPDGHDQRLDPDLRIPLQRGRLDLRLLDRHRHRELRPLLGPGRHPHPGDPARRRHLHLPRPRDRRRREPGHAGDPQLHGQHRRSARPDPDLDRPRLARQPELAEGPRQRRRRLPGLDLLDLGLHRHPARHRHRGRTGNRDHGHRRRQLEHRPARHRDRLGQHLLLLGAAHLRRGLGRARHDDHLRAHRHDQRLDPDLRLLLERVRLELRMPLRRRRLRALQRAGRDPHADRGARRRRTQL